MDGFDRKRKKFEALMKQAVEKGVCIAFSGGADSSLLLAAASNIKKESGGTVYGVMFDTFLHGKGDEENARKVAAECGADFHVIAVNELDYPAILNNPLDRCYQCKKFLFTKLRAFADQHHCPVIMDGTNGDDLQVYRPGLKALSELAVESPLREVGFTKKEVRALAGEYGISAAERPSNSCLATRLPYGQELERGLLERIAEGEAYLADLGFEQIRIRVHGRIARIEVKQGQIPAFAERRKEIISRLKELGFVYITLDLEGFRSGSMDL